MSADRDDDPTGMRRLLRDLSEPAPMSEDLVRRISEDIENERRRTDGPAPQRFDPAVDRPRRRASVALGTAAAAATVIVGTGALVLLGGLGRAAHDVIADGASSVMAPPAALGAVNAAPAHPAQDPGSITLVASGTTYHRGALRDQVRDVLEGRAPESASGPDGPTLTACLRSLALDGRAVVVDVATFDGRPSLTVIGDEDVDHHRTVAVMPASCGHSDRTPLAGPYRFR